MHKYRVVKVTEPNGYVHYIPQVRRLAIFWVRIGDACSEEFAKSLCINHSKASRQTVSYLYF